MLAIALIVFREVLEAALVVGIVLAASKGVPRRSLWVSAGVLGGVLGAMLVAGFAEQLAAAVAGVGQEIFNAAVLFTAVAMLGWHNIWMSRHGRELAVEATSVGREVSAGTRPLYALAVVVGLAVLREGSELVLFVYGLVASQGGSLGPAALTGGGLLGLAAGIAAGAALYLGLLRIPMRHLFTVTSWLILLLAAGMASQGAAFLVQADLLPPLGGAMWDTSFLLTEHSLIGQALHALVGYVARPTGIQLAFYAGTLVVIGGLMRCFGRSGAPKRESPKPAASAAE
jgi:high-affinity iron transporter